MLEEFPFLHVSPQTAHSMWNKQARHLSSVFKSGAATKKTKTQRMIEDAEKRQEALVGILKKDLDHNLRMVRPSSLQLNFAMAEERRFEFTILLSKLVLNDRAILGLFIHIFVN